VPESAVSVIRARDLRARWTTPRATEPGYMRWTKIFGGGRHGSSAKGTTLGIGLMGLPVAQRQAGFHKHTVTEI
jgi:hypothetical protein